MSTEKRDYLDLLASRTVWCPRLELLESEVDEGFGHGNPEGPCSLCKGIEEIPDPRFKKLRVKKSCDNLDHVVDAQHNKIYCNCYTGYSVIRDLGALLEIAAQDDDGWEACFTRTVEADEHSNRVTKKSLRNGNAGLTPMDSPWPTHP